MALNKICFVGIDEKTKTEQLLQKFIKYDLIQAQTIEVGFLYSETKEGKHPRYPRAEFISELIKNLNYSYYNDIKSSVHLCGKSAIDFINGSINNRIIDSLHSCDRIQLNFSANSLNSRFDISRKLHNLYEEFRVPFILQNNSPENNIMINNMIEYFSQEIPFTNVIDVLYDNSRGKGKTLSDPISTIANDYVNCGYAGGINPANVSSILDSINKVNFSSSDDWYIDMESGIRDDNDWFSIEKCNKVLNNVKKWTDRNYSI